MQINNIKSLYLLTFIVLGIIWISTSSFQQTNELTKEQAIELAEQFIIDNGYTNLFANKVKLSYELLDDRNKNKVISRRKNTLHKKAFCISERDDRWDVGFLSTSIDLNKLDSKKRETNLPGRAVIVLKNGKGIKIAHKTPLFSYFEKLI
ncbi:hypothetical protein [Tenacibaculum amylolyticum]|uniref:hypothetical protein n=1 Tax=Tenacibaculum amylolyticum TaxID=104269 RepID=UPI0038965D76